MEHNEEYTNLFEYLKSIRIKKDISLESIARDSRIQISYLEAIESGDFEKIPPVYDKLFFQTYVSYLKVDNPDKYTNDFKLLRKEIYYPTPSTTIQKIKTSKIQNHPVFNLKTLFFVGPVMLIVVIISFMAINSQLIGTNETTQVKEIPVRKIVQDIEKKKQPEVIPEQGNEQNHQNKVNVSIVAVDTTWLRFVKDQNDTTEYMLYIGNNINIGADSVLSFLVGNASGVKFTVNGIEKGFLGKPGEVISSLKVTAAGIANLQVKMISNRGINDTTAVFN